MNQRNRDARLLTGGLIGAPSGTVGRRGVGTVDSGSPPITNAVDLDGSNDYLSWSSPAASNRRTNTLSFWLKPEAVSGALFQQRTTSTSSDPQFIIEQLNVSGTNRLRILDQNSGNKIILDSNSDLTFSTGTWYHLVVSVDTTQATNTDRVKVWVNGQQYTNWSSPVWPPEDYSTGINRSGTRMLLGVQRPNSSTTLNNHTNGQIADAHFIDGQALTADDFGEDVSGTWSAKAYTGTYGTNGFHLNFTDGANLGTDNSSNGNDFTEVSLTTSNQVAISTSDIPQVIPEATPLRTRGYLGAAPAGGGMLTLYDRYVDNLT